MASQGENDEYKPWYDGTKPEVYYCDGCRDLIWSACPGEWACCACGESYVDQTRHYTRIGGSAQPSELSPQTLPEK